MEYKEDEYLQISGLQHFSFCRRQWALIHLEQQWNENLRTVEGELMHERAHDESLSEKRGDLLTVRGLRVSSPLLGVSGSCDVVEFRKSPTGVRLFNYDGLWQPCPIEYKRGSPKLIDADRLQLCAQAMCLEEMLGAIIQTGAIFYGETRRRETVALDEQLRSTVKSMLSEMHQYRARGYTPKVKPGKHCNACSLKNICLPALCKNISVSDYISTCLGEDLL